MKLGVTVALGAVISVITAANCLYAQVPIVPSQQKNQAVSAVTEGLQFLVTLDQNTYTADQPVYLDVAIENTTDSPLPQLYPVPDVAATMNFLVRTPDGKPVSLTTYGKERYSKADFASSYFSVSNHPYSVPPVPAHGALKYHLLLSRIYDLSKGGAYTVIAKQLIPTLSSKGVAVLESRPLWFQIAEDNKELAPFKTNPAL